MIKKKMREGGGGGGDANRTTLKKLLNILITKSSHPMSSIITQNCSCATVSSNFAHLEKYGLFMFSSSPKVLTRSLKMSYTKI